MAEKITKRTFISPINSVTKTSVDTDSFYLLLLSGEDYEQILRCLVRIYKQRIRDRERYERKSKRQILPPHETKVIPIIDNLTEDDANVIIESISQCNRKQSPRKVFEKIIKGMDGSMTKMLKEKRELERKQKELEAKITNRLSLADSSDDESGEDE